MHSLDAQAVENPVNPGTPDVEYIGGWIELKYIEELPKRPDTPIRVPHFRPEQKVWIVKRTNKGGRVHVLLRVENTFFLLDGMFAVNKLGTLTYAQLATSALAVWYRSIDGQELINVLTAGTMDNARSAT